MQPGGLATGRKCRDGLNDGTMLRWLRLSKKRARQRGTSISGVRLKDRSELFT